MARLIPRLIVFLGILVVLDAVVARALDSVAPRHYRVFVDSKHAYAERAADTELLVLGDSHAADAVVPGVIERATGLSAYNFGVYHQLPIELYYLTQDLIRRSPKLKTVVIGTNPSMFARGVESSRYTPMFIESPLGLLQLLIATDSTQLGLLTRAGKKSELFEPLLRRLLGRKTRGGAPRDVEAHDHGYVPNVACRARLDIPLYSNWHDQAITQSQVKYFERTLDLLDERGIRTILVHPPLLPRYFEMVQRTRGYREFLAAMKDLERTRGLTVLGPGNDYGMSLDEGQFYDPTHLCKPGALQFSAWLAPQLR